MAGGAERAQESELRGRDRWADGASQKQSVPGRADVTGTRTGDGRPSAVRGAQVATGSRGMRDERDGGSRRHEAQKQGGGRWVVMLLGSGAAADATGKLRRPRSKIDDKTWFPLARGRSVNGPLASSRDWPCDPLPPGRDWRAQLEGGPESCGDRPAAALGGTCVRRGLVESGFVVGTRQGRTR